MKSSILVVVTALPPVSWQPSTEQRLQRSPFLPFSSLTPKIFVPAQTRDISSQIGSRPIFRHTTTAPPFPLRAKNTCPERSSFAGHSADEPLPSPRSTSDSRHSFRLFPRPSGITSSWITYVFY